MLRVLSDRGRGDHDYYPSDTLANNFYKGGGFLTSRPRANSSVDSVLSSSQQHRPFVGLGSRGSLPRNPSFRAGPSVSQLPSRAASTQLPPPSVDCSHSISEVIHMPKTKQQRQRRSKKLGRGLLVFSFLGLVSGFGLTIAATCFRFQQLSTGLRLFPPSDSYVYDWLQLRKLEDLLSIDVDAPSCCDCLSILSSVGLLVLHLYAALLLFLNREDVLNFQNSADFDEVAPKIGYSADEYLIHRTFWKDYVSEGRESEEVESLLSLESGTSGGGPAWSGPPSLRTASSGHEILVPQLRATGGERRRSSLAAAERRRSSRAAAERRRSSRAAAERRRSSSSGASAWSRARRAGSSQSSEGGAVWSGPSLAQRSGPSSWGDPRAGRRSSRSGWTDDLVVQDADHLLPNHSFVFSSTENLISHGRENRSSWQSRRDNHEADLRDSDLFLLQHHSEVDRDMSLLEVEDHVESGEESFHQRRRSPVHDEGDDVRDGGELVRVLPLRAARRGSTGSPRRRIEEPLSPIFNRGSVASVAPGVPFDEDYYTDASA